MTLARIEGGGQGSEVVVERVILAVGIVGNVEDIGLEDTGVEVERSHVVVDEWLRTCEPGVYAIGDLVGPPWLAHKAMHEGVICVGRIAGVNERLRTGYPHLKPKSLRGLTGGRGPLSKTDHGRSAFGQGNGS